MTTIQQQVKRARTRLWLNTWFDIGCRVFTWGAIGFALQVLLARLFGWALPLSPIAAGVAGIALVISIVWSVYSRPGIEEAAAALDEIVGLRERVSSSLYCEGVEDPFAQAVCADAHEKVNSVTVRQHMRLRFPDRAFGMSGAMLVAVLMFLVPNGLLSKAEGKDKSERLASVTRTKVAVKKQMNQLKEMAKTNPALSDLEDEINKLDMLPAEKMTRPSDVRQEALKKIDKLSDAIKKKQSDNRFDKVSETKKMLRSLKAPSKPQTPVEKLTRNLANGDFKSAQENLKEMKEQLATLKHDSDQEFVKKMQKQLEELSKQLEDAASQKQLKKKLEQAGIDKKEVERMLQRLSKEDIEKIKKQLEKQGMSQKQIEQTVKQCQKQQGACKACQKMGQAMQKAAQGAGAGQMGNAAQAMDQAGDQLSEMESLEQEMNQLNSSLSELQNAKNDMNNTCPQCNGTGKKDGKPCSNCGGSGQKPGQGQGQGGGKGKGGGQGGGMGDLGQGRGGVVSQEETPVDFKMEREKVQVTKGRIIGQFLVDGEQVKGEAKDDFVELISAAERTATDTVNRDRIPRQYQKAVKEYFSRLPAGFEMESKEGGDSAQGEKTEGKTEGKAETGKKATTETAAEESTESTETEK